jgi:hypothetical protein
MQNRFFGDVGDFGKYGLLRILSGMTSGAPMLKLGIVWYLIPDETHNADGKFISYLLRKDGFFRDCDEQLYDELRSLLFDETGQIIAANRNVSSAETSGILHEGTLFYSQPLAYPENLSTSNRSTLRKEWFAPALIKVASADVVFVDPDNGIECPTYKRISKKGPKYVFWDDLDAFVERGQSVIVYHHHNRDGTHPQQVERILGKMRSRWTAGATISAATFKRGTNRSYFIVAAPQHNLLLNQRLEKMRSGLWSRHFDFELG